MNRTLRFILIVAGVLIIVLLVAPFFIPVNQFKPTIEEKASAALGRKVQLGNLSLSLIHGALSAEDLSIGDDPKFSPSPFLTAKSLSVGVEMIPLIFSKQLNVTDIAIVEPQVTLLKNGAGEWNYSTIGNSSPSPRTESKPAASSTSNSSADISVKKLQLKDGKITIGNTTSQKRSTYDHVNVSASDVSLNSKFPVTVNAALPGGGTFKLDGNIGPVDKSDSTLTPLDAKLEIGMLNLATTGVLDPSLGLGGIVDVNSTVANQGGFAETKGTIKLTKALLVQGGSPAGVPLDVDLKISGEGMPAKDLEAFLPAIGMNLPKGSSLTAGTLNTNLIVKGPTNKLVTDGTIGLNNAKLSGFDLGSKMSAISALTGLKTGKDMDIEKMSTNVHMAPTGLRADNFLAVVPGVGNLTGAGTLDAKNTLDFKMAATLTGGAIGAMGSSGGGVASLVGALGGSKGSSCKGGTTIPFMIEGTASEPKFVPDVGGAAANMLKSQFGCAGGSLANVGKTGTEAPAADAVKALGGLFGKKKTP